MWPTVEDKTASLGELRRELGQLGILVPRPASGVMCTLDAETGCRDVILVNAAYGLGETW